MGVDLGDDARAVGARVEGGDDSVGPAFRLRAGTALEPLGFIVADDHPVVLLDDDAVAGLLDDARVALDALLTALLHLLETPRLGCRRQHARGRWGADAAGA